MELKNQEELSKLIDLCRKKGISSLKIGTLEINLREDVPESPYKQKKKEREIQQSPDIVGNPIAEAERALFWSSTIEGEAQ